MEYQVSARKHRPMTFAEVTGQTHVVRTLTNALASGRTAHAYLFSGMRGVGKTTMARILAKALNCEKGPTPTPCLACVSCREIGAGMSFDVMEIDGASSNSVDDVREMRETVKTAPAYGRYRVYIIDEVHMLSTAAFNALLKTLEEPPAHVVFVFATTEAHKVPQTILSRCQHFTFRRIPRREVVDTLKRVTAAEGITIDDRSLSALARASDGSLRDALSLLDQAVAFGGKRVEAEQLMILLGAVPHELLRGALARAARDESPIRSVQSRSAGRTAVQGERVRTHLGAPHRTIAAHPRGDAVTVRAAGAGESGLGSSGRTGSCRAAQHRRVPRGFWTGGYSGRSGDGRLSRVGRDRHEDDAAGKLPTGGRGSMLGAGRPAPARARRVAGWRNGRADGRAASAGTRSDEGAPSSR